MKKIVFALVVLLFAAPAWADVVITATQVEETNEVEITYEVTLPDTNLPRAFGLDITVTDGNIIACTPAMEGECDISVKGFGIFPGTIDIDDTVTPPVVNTYGTPVAPAGARGALGGLDTNGITIEMGSLYEGPNAPPLSGLLCTIILDADANCTVNIAGNAARCGVEGSEAPGDAIGVVMEDPTEVVTIDYVPGTVDPWVIDCFPSALTEQYADWVAMGKPGCWCGSGDPNANPRQCHGDATGEPPEGGAKTGYWYVGLGDLNILVSAWKVLEPAVDPTPSGPGIATIPGGICADFSHSAEGGAKTGYWRVGLGDPNILVGSWKVLEPAVEPTPSGPGVAADCPN
jgi:hypothetical protein